MPSGPKIVTGPITNFSVTNATTSTTRSVSISWGKPASKYFAGTMIRYKTGGYPTSVSDGALAYNGTGNSVSITTLKGGEIYYFRAFPYAKNKSGTKTVYNTTTTGQQASLDTLNNPVTLSLTNVSTNALTVNWTSNNDSNRAIYIRYKAGSYPTSYSDGTGAYTNWDINAGSVNVTGLASGTAYYFKAFTHNSSGAWVTYDSNIANTKVHVPAGSVEFTSSGYWTCPAGVTKATLFCVGGGAAGSPYVADATTVYASAGGNGGYTKTVWNAPVTPGTSYPVVIGAGGNAQASTGSNGYGGFYTTEGTKNFNAASGGATSIGGSLCTAAGGEGIQVQTGTVKYIIVGKGGSGGGGMNGAGGSNGSNGVGTNSGLGQGTTTRGFADVNNAHLFSGGGGGGGIGSANDGPGGAGGGANGSHGGYGISASANTGGGGGGTNVGIYNYQAGSGGSGFAAIYWPEQ